MKFLEKDYINKTVLITGHTGFKGSWLSLWLKNLGAKVIGISKEIVHTKGLYTTLSRQNIFSKEYFLDVIDRNKIEDTLIKINPDYIFHLAAQSIVSKSYDEPSLTFHTNAIGTMNILDSIKSIEKKINLIMITSDKCYENVETFYGYKEIDQLGGKDPYSASKACAEIISNCYARSIYNKIDNISIATARAGNVIGGGDWSKDRLIPDAVNAWQNQTILKIRNPKSTRPWQHVLEPLRGYLLLGAFINNNEITKETLSSISFNFGPRTDDVIEVQEVIKLFSKFFDNSRYEFSQIIENKEASLLNLSFDKSSSILGWYPKLTAQKALKYAAEWYLAQFNGEDIFDLSIQQINEYSDL